MQKIFCLLLLTFLLAGSAQCDENRSLKETLVGTWNYVSASPKKAGPFKSVKPTKIYWTLRADGSGVYYRKINQFNAASVHDKLTWSVKDRTLTLDGDLHYTIVEWDESRMLWQNPSKTTFFVVEKE